MTTIGYATLQIIPSLDGVTKAMDKQLGGLAGRGKAAGKALGDGIASGVDVAAKRVEQASKKIQTARDKEADSAGKLRVAEERLKEVRDKGATGSTLARAEEAREKALRGQASALDSVASETKALASANRELAREQERAKNSGGGGSTNFLSGITSELNGVTSKFSSVGRGAGAGFAAGAVAALLAGGLFEAGKSAAGLVADGFKSIVTAGVDFDKTFNNFQAVTGSSTSQMAAFRSEAIALGGDTQIAGANASDAATAMTELAKAGFTVDQAMAGARGTLQLATAAQISAADAATIEGNALNTFGLQADQAGRAADVLANVANASSGEMTDFANGLQQGGAVANQFGISIEDTAATLGVLANNGIKGSDAGTLMKSALLALASPSDQAGQALDELGVKAFDSTGKFVGMRAIFDQLHTASQKLTPEMYAMSASTAFGSDAARLAGVAASKGAEGFDLMRTAVDKQGTAAQVAATQNQGLPGVIENIKNSVDTMKLSLYDVISGPLKALGGEAQGGLGELQNAINTHKPELIAFFTDIGASAATLGGAMLKMTGLFLEGFGQIIGGVGNLLGALTQADEAIQRLMGHDDVADGLEKTAQGYYGWGSSLEAVGKAMQDAGGEVSALNPKIQEAGKKAQASAEFMRSLGDNITTLPDGKTIVLKDNSPEAIARIDKTKFTIEQLPDSKDFKIVALTDEAGREIDAWRVQQGQEPVKVPVLPTVTSQALQQAFAGAGPVQVPIPGTYPAPAPGAGLPAILPHARGGQISGPGTGVSDSILARVSTGEFIVNADATRKNMPLLEVINSGKLPGFAGGGVVGPDVQAAHDLVGTKYSQGNRTDCSGMAARVIARALGLPESSLMSTKNAAQWLAKAGFQPGIGGPGQLSVGWYDHGPNPNDGHMAITLSDGTNAEAGGKNGVFTVGAGASGASDPQFDQHMFLPKLFTGEGPGGGFASGYAGSGYSGGGGTPGIGPNGEAGTYSAPDAKSVREANEKVADADARAREADLRVKELKADASESEKASAQNAADKAKREAADARTDLAEVQKGKFTAGKDGGISGSGASKAPGVSLPTSLSGFGSAIGQFAGGQIGSALGVLGIPDSPSWLGAASQLLGGIKVADKSGNPIFDGSNPLAGFGGGSAAPLSASSGAWTPPDNAGNVHGTRAGQAPGPQTVYNIRTATVEDAFLAAQRKQDVRMASKMDRY